MRSVRGTRSVQFLLPVALVAGSGVVSQTSAVALTGACDLTGSSPGVHVAGEGYTVRGTQGDDIIVARGDCFSINGLAGNDRITFLGDGYLKVQNINGGEGNDRICTRQGTKERVDGGPGINKVLADPKDLVINAQEVDQLNCS